MNLRQVIIGGFVAAFALGASPVVADEQAIIVSGQPNKITMYGHTLDPASIELTEDDIPWEKLEGFVPQVFTDAQTSSMTKEELCDLIFMRHDQYRDATEARRMVVIDAFGPSFTESFKESDLVSMIAAPTTDGIKKLIYIKPEAEDMLRDLRAHTISWAAMERLHDAAIEVCPDYAQEKGRSPILTDDGPAYDPNSPEEKAGWDAFEAQFKEDPSP